MKFVVRADASLAIGSGHVMRCRTLAGELRRRGHTVRFACRDLPGNLLALLKEGGYPTGTLPAAAGMATGLEAFSTLAAHADATATLQGAKGAPDWVIVDHYGLDARWEAVFRQAGTRVLALDDLADRPHDCDVLLDQNPGEAARYAARVPPGARLLVGAEWALVRPEFAALRAESLARRAQPVLQRLLVFLGGGDATAAVQSVLAGALASGIGWSHVDVVLGSGAPGAQAVQQQLRHFASATLHIQTEAMPRLMADADLAITAGGSVNWEKCCLGLPSVVAVLADNQEPIAAELQARGAALVLPRGGHMMPAGLADALRSLTPAGLARMATAAAALCTGQGAARVADELEQGMRHG